jgi:conjugal transfer pilus assembly protein TraK
MFETLKNSKTMQSRVLQKGVAPRGVGGRVSLAPILAALALGWLQSARGAELIEDADLKPQVVIISVAEQNALSIQGRRIASVIPPQNGLFQVQKDDALGVLYFRLSAPSTQAISVFVTDDRGTRYQLMMNPKAVPAQDIVLKASVPVALSAMQSLTQADGVTRPMAYQKRIKELMLALADRNGSTRLTTTIVNTLVPLWTEGRLLYQEKVFDNDFVGEVYELTNTGASDLHLVEQELIRPGVIAVSIAQHSLEPQARTAIYIIRMRQAHEPQ